MKNKKLKRIVTSMMIVTNAFLLVACGSNKSADMQSSGRQTTEMTEETVEIEADMAKADTSMADSATATTSVTEEKLASTQGIGDTLTNSTTQKLIKDVNLTVETKEFDTFLTELNSQIASLGGYVQSSNISGGSSQHDKYRYGNIVARIPADQLDGFVQIVNEKGNITNKSENTTDVTLQYVDMESHIKALKVEQETLLGLLENAEKMEDVIAIQSQLTQVRYELESYESQIRTYDNLVDYSTVTIDIYEVERETNTEAPTFGNEIKAKLGNNLYAIKEGLRSFVINFIAALPYIVIWAVVIFVFFTVGRKIYKKIYKKEEKEKKEDKKKENNKE